MATQRTVSSTVLGAGALIKNGMGAAAVIVIVTICIVPIAKLAMFVVTYQFIGAFTQPICGREFANMVTGFAEAMKLMMSLVIYSMITIFLERFKLFGLSDAFVRQAN